MTLETWQWCSLLSEFWTFFTCTSTPPTSPSLIPLHPSLAPSSVLNYPAVLSFSRGSRCWRSAEGSPCAVCFPPPFFPPFSLPLSPRLPQPRRKGNEGGRRQEEREGSYRPGGASEKGGPTKARVMERRVGHIKLPTRKRLDRRDRWIKGLTEERLTYYGSTRDFLA